MFAVLMILFWVLVAPGFYLMDFIDDMTGLFSGLSNRKLEIIGSIFGITIWLLIFGLVGWWLVS